MTRLVVSIPDDLLTKLDRQAKREQRSRSELVREAARRYLSQPPEPLRKEDTAPAGTSMRRPQKWTKEKLEQYLLEKGTIRRGSPELDVLLGSVAGPVDMAKVLAIGKKLSGLSQHVIADREDRV